MVKTTFGRLALLLMPLVALLLTGCGEVIENKQYQQINDSSDADNIPKNLASSITVLARPGYLSPHAIAQFQDKYNVLVNVEKFDTIEEGYGKIQTGKCDLALISGAMLKPLLNQHVLVKMDQANLTNLHDLEVIFHRVPYDQTHQFSLPYLWRTIGIGYDSTRETQLPQTWADLLVPSRWTPEKRELLRNKVGMFDEGRYVIGMALIHLGFSPNTERPDEIIKAGQLLMNLQSYVRVFDDNNARTYLATDETFMASAWSSDVAIARRTNPKIRFAIPAEGTMVFIDYFTVLNPQPKKKRTAEAFIDFMINPAIAADNSGFSFAASASRKAKVFLSRDIVNGPSYTLPDEDKMYFLDSVSAVAQNHYSNVWQEVRNSVAKSN